MDVFAIGSTLLTILFARQRNYVVLNLESCAQGIRKFNELLGGCRVLLRQLRDHPDAHTRQTGRFVLNHVEVLSFSGCSAFPVVPLDVPALPNVQILHFLAVDFV